MEIMKIHKKAGQKTATISFPNEFIHKEMDFVLETEQTSENISSKMIEDVKSMFGIWKDKKIPQITEDDFYIR